MVKLSFAAAVYFSILALCTFGQLAPRETLPSGQGARPQSLVGAADQLSDSPLGDCAPTKLTSDLNYPAIPTSYVGGTIPGMPLSPGHWKLGKLLLRLRQFRVNGKLALSSHCLVFAFDSQKLSELRQGFGYEIFKCPDKASASIQDASKCVELSSTTVPSPSSYVIAVPYSGVNLLSRAKYPTSDLTSASGTYALAAGSILTAIAGAIHKTAAKERALGIAAAVLTLYYYVTIAKPRLGDNYIAVFVEKQAAPPPSPAISQLALNGNLTPSKSVSLMGNLTTNQPPASDEIFKKGDVLMFRIPNHHDYYNISMLLSGATGLTFVSETAEKTGK